MSGGHGHIEGANKKVALLIAVLALALALSETFGKSAQTAAISYNIEASNLWAFFQAKTIRQTVIQASADELELLGLAGTADARAREAIEKRVDSWRKTAARYESEPDKQEGRKELMARALAAEKQQKLSLEKYHHFEVASAAFQIAIVLASATVITGMMAMTWLAGGLGLLGLFFTGIGLFAPKLIHLF